MNYAKTLCTLAALSLLGLAQPASAVAGPRSAKPQTQRRAPTRARRRARVAPRPAELRCHLEAFADAAGTQPIADRASVHVDRIWLRFSVRNVGGLPADGFQNNVRVSSGSNTEQDAYELSLLPGFSTRSPLFEVPLKGSGAIATMEIDTEDDVEESHEGGNYCMVQVRYEKLH